MRKDLFKDEVINESLVYGALSGPHCQLRGLSKSASFIKDFWSSKEVIKCVSEAAGVELTPVFDYELGELKVDGG